jgi:hypothetical protein
VSAATSKPSSCRAEKAMRTMCFWWTCSLLALVCTELDLRAYNALTIFACVPFPACRVWVCARTHSGIQRTGNWLVQSIATKLRGATTFAEVCAHARAHAVVKYNNASFSDLTCALDEQRAMAARGICLVPRLLVRTQGKPTASCTRCPHIRAVTHSLTHEFSPIVTVAPGDV